MTFIVKTRGAPRPVRKDFICARHGKFTALVDSDTDSAPCPRAVPIECACGYPDCDAVGQEECNEQSPWSPSVIPMRMRRVEATRGKNDAPEHADWNFTQNFEDGQDPDDWQADRDAAAERRREQFVIDAVRSDR